MNKACVRLSLLALSLCAGVASAATVVKPFEATVVVRNAEGADVGAGLALARTSDVGAKFETYSMSQAGSSTAWAFTNGPQSLSYNADPIIDYAFGVKNSSAGVLSFVFSFLGGYVGGPYDTLSSNYSSTLLVDAAGGAVATNTFSFIHNPQLDGGTVAGGQLGDGCSLGGSASGTCDPGGPDVLVPVASFGSGVFGVSVSFTLSPGDSFALLGEVELSQIPEPGTWTLLFAGLLGLFAVARRRLS